MNCFEQAIETAKATQWVDLQAKNMRLGAIGDWYSKAYGGGNIAGRYKDMEAETDEAVAYFYLTFNDRCPGSPGRYTNCPRQGFRKCQI